MLPIGTVGDRDVSADLQQRLLLGLTLLLLLAACSTALASCSTADNDAAARFSKAQKLRQNALLAARLGDTASALDDIDQVQVLEPLTSRSPGLTPPSMSSPEHRAIAPAAGKTTCSNIGINRFSCF